MKINSFTVQGFRNLARPVTFGPLESFNLLHGPNGAGKSNLLQSMDVFFRLLGTGNSVSKDARPTMLENGEQTVGYPFSQLFNLSESAPIQWKAELSVSAEELEEMSIEPELPTDRVTIVAELIPALGGQAQLRILQFMLGDADLSKLDPEKDEGVGFGQTIRSYIAGMLDLDPTKRGSPFRRIDLRRPAPTAASGSAASDALVPASILDALFDARQALDREQRARWNLFARLMQELEPELGPGQFETAFDRKTGRAGLVYDTTAATYPLEWLGSGAQHLVALCACLALSRARFVSLEEPELHLSPSLQERLPRLLATVVESGLGARQLFICSQSRALDASGATFVMEAGAEGAVLEKKAWEGAPAPAAAARPSPSTSAPRPAGTSRTEPAAAVAAGEGDLDGLIGLVDQLAELDPEEIVGQTPAAGAPASAPKSSPAPTRQGEAKPAAAAGSGRAGEPPWKWQPGSNRPTGRR